jgi:ubiquinone/menaquinone biosynthesis C-methylase UbiE
MNSKHSSKPSFKSFWEGNDDSGHAVTEENSYKEFAEEMIPYFSSTEIVLDCGCGSGEMLTHSAPHIKELIAFDYSSTMLTKAKQLLDDSKIDNVELFKANFIEIDQFLKKQVNTIFSNGVHQYVNFDESLIFLKKAKKKLLVNGEIFFFNVPNIKYINLFGLGVFNFNDRIDPKNLAKKYLRLSKDILKEKIKNKKYVYDAGIGYWYSQQDFRNLADQTGFKVEFFASKFMQYGYRMHVKFTVK